MPTLRSLVGPVLLPALVVAAVVGPDWERALSVEPYRDGETPLFADRPYVNRAPTAALDGLRVVRLPRHLRFDVVLELAAPARVLRLVSEENDDAVFAGWAAQDLALHVEGHSCQFTGAVARTLPAGRHRLPPGGPVAAAPLLVESRGAVAATTTHGWNKLTPGAGPLELVLRNERKLAALAVGYAALAFALARARSLSGRGRSPGPPG